MGLRTSQTTSRIIDSGRILYPNQFITGSASYQKNITYGLIDIATASIAYNSWQLVKNYSASEMSNGIYIIDFYWSRADTAFQGSTQFFGVHTNTATGMIYTDMRSDYGVVVGGGTYNEKLYWRFTGIESGQSKIEVYWYSRAGVSGTSSPVTITAKLVRVKPYKFETDFT